MLHLESFILLKVCCCRECENVYFTIFLVLNLPEDCCLTGCPLTWFTTLMEFGWTMAGCLGYWSDDFYFDYSVGAGGVGIGRVDMGSCSTILK